jgi:hypothetical protein
MNLNLNRVITGAVTDLPPGMGLELHAPVNEGLRNSGRYFSYGPTRWVERVKPQSVGEPRRKKIYDEWVFVVRNALVTSDNQVFAQDGTPLQPADAWAIGGGGEQDFETLAKDAELIENRVAFGGLKGRNSTEQWWLRVMPRVTRLRQLCGDIPALVPRMSKQSSSLWDVTGLNPTQRLNTPRPSAPGSVTAVRVGELLITNQLVLPSGISPARFDHVQREFSDFPAPTHPAKKIYIVPARRRPGDKGAMLNHDAAAEIAENLGFTIVRAETQTDRELVALFTAAHLVVGEWGKSLPPAVLGPANQLVVEISP